MPTAARWSPALLALPLALYLLGHPAFEGDTRMLVHGVDAVRSCLARGQWSNCPDTLPFALFQYLPSLGLRALGADPERVGQALAWLSGTAFAAMLALFHRTLRRRSESVAWLALLVLATSPLLWYAHSSFGEMAAATFIVAFAAACLAEAAPWRIALPLFFAAITKDTSLPFLLLIAAAALGIPRTAAERGRWLGVAAGAAAGFAANSAFNWFRVGSIWNLLYLNPLLIVPRWQDQLSFFFALWLSPNGGLAPFWPTFVALAVALGRPSNRGMLGAWAVLAGMTLGLSRWYSPFGWHAWGPRLLLPWVPVSLLLLLWYAPAAARERVTSLFTRGKHAVLFALLALIALPQIQVIFRPHIMDEMFAPDPSCPITPFLPENLARNYECMEKMVWPARAAFLKLLAFPPRPGVIALTVLYLALLASLCLRIRLAADAGTDRSTRVPGSP